MSIASVVLWPGTPVLQVDGIPFLRTTKTIPRALEAEEVKTLIKFLRFLKQRLLLSVAYVLSLRLAELIHLEWSDTEFK